MRARPGDGRLHRWRAWLIWAVFGLDLALVIGGGLAVGAWPDTPAYVPALFAAMVASLGGVGALVATRKPGDPVGWILLASASMVTLAVWGEDYVRLSLTDFGGALPLTVAIAWLFGLAFGPAIILLAGVMPLYFPDGRLLSRRWRWVVWIAAFGIAMGVLAPAVAPGRLPNTTIDNPLGIPGLDLGGLLALSNVLLAVVVLPMAIASSILKYRRGSPTVREQLKWFSAVALLTVTGFVAGVSGIAPISSVGSFLGIAGLVLLPIAIGIAILRYRLYEIDRIISRTVGYAVVTGILALVFLGTILVFSETVLVSFFSGSSVAVAASTLVVAALFQPLRRRVQSIIDRRFNRSRYDAERTVAAFAAHLRDEVALERLEADIGGVVSLTLAPTSVGLWIRLQDPRA